jgi:hypothetical protein
VETSDLTGTSPTFAGAFAHSYALFSVATDNLGDRQATLTEPETTTTLPSLLTMATVDPVTNKKHLVSQILVGFSGAVNAGEADSVATYRLATAGKKGSFTARNAQFIKLKSAEYNPASDSITLTPKKAFALGKPVQLVVDGEPPSGLEDSLGRLIDGDHNGTAGGDAIAILTKKSVTSEAVEQARTQAQAAQLMSAAVVDALLAHGELASSRGTLRAGREGSRAGHGV